MEEKKLRSGPDRLELVSGFAFSRQVDFFLESGQKLFIMVRKIGRMNESEHVWRIEGWTPRDGKMVPIQGWYDTNERSGVVTIGAQ